MNPLTAKMREMFTDEVMPSYIYTYPVKKRYQPFNDWEKACESWKKVKGDLAVYIHIPFCEMKCSFCDLFTVTKRPDLIDSYVDSLIQEMDLMKPYLQANLIVKSVYFGGGTPALLNEGHLFRLSEHVNKMFCVLPSAEWSIEGAPNSFGEGKFESLKKCGFNRVSLGIQSFDAVELSAMGRNYESKLGQQTAESAIGSGIENVNLDLIYGIPGQTFEKWKINLEKAIALNPQTLTLYPLAVRPRTAFGKLKMFSLARERYQWYDFTHQVLHENGYEQHTVVTYAKGKGGCRHEANEFSGAHTLSFGAGARKYAPDLHYVDEDYRDRKHPLMTTKAYMETVREGRIPVKSGVLLSGDDKELRKIILALLSSGLREWPEQFSPFFRALEEEGYFSAGKLTSKGKRYSSHIGNFLVEGHHVV